jgi:hypothetical protein
MACTWLSRTGGGASSGGGRYSGGLWCQLGGVRQAYVGWAGAAVCQRRLRQREEGRVVREVVCEVFL